MNADLLILVALAGAGLPYVVRAPLSLPVVFAAQGGLIAIGLVAAQAQGVVPRTAVLTYVCSVIAVVVGYFAIARLVGKRVAPPLEAVPSRAVATVVAVAGLLATYHLLKGGVPVLSSGVERERFDFTSSGLLGIPGRMFLFGTTFAWILAAANSSACGVKFFRDKTARWATFFLLVPGALSGFKGSLVYIVITMTVVATILSGRRIWLGRLAARYWPVAVVLIANFLLVASLYETVRASGQSPLDLVVNRLTTIPAEPVSVALSDRIATSAPAWPFVSDFQYFVEKYFHVGNSIGFSYENAVSAYMIGANPISATFLVPVTVGGIAESYAMGGTVFAICASAIAGGLLAKLEYSTAGTALGRAVALSTMLAIFYWLVRGGLAYYFINYAAVIGMLSVIAMAMGARLTSTERHRVTSAEVG